MGDSVDALTAVRNAWEALGTKQAAVPLPANDRSQLRRELGVAACELEIALFHYFKSVYAAGEEPGDEAHAFGDATREYRRACGRMDPARVSGAAKQLDEAWAAFEGTL